MLVTPIGRGTVTQQVAAASQVAFVAERTI